MSEVKKELPIVVVGSGAGGMPLAATLAEQGFQVVLVERGKVSQASEYPTNEYDYELREKPWMRNSKEWQGPVSLQRGIGLGGSTLYFQALSHMPSASVMKKWGLPVKKIEKITHDVSNYLKIAGVAQPPHPLNLVSTHLYKSAQTLNWKIRPAPVAILSKEYQGRPACNYCGQCVYGCIPGDKSSVDKTWLQRAKASENLTILLNSTVERIVLGSATTAKSVYITSEQGGYEIEVSAVIVAAGALETPYLLKRSRQQYAEQGIGNHNVGRNMTGTLWQSLLVSLPEVEGAGHAGIPIDLLVEEFESDDFLLCQGRNTAGIVGPVSAARFALQRYGHKGLREWMRNHYTKLAGLGAYGESAVAYEDGLSYNDAKRYEKRLQESDQGMLGKMRAALQKWSEAANATHHAVLDGGNSPFVGAMFRGTCRIGSDSENSAVDPNGFLYGYKNIVISDASVLGRGLIADPSLPLQVLAVHFAEHLTEKLKMA